MRLSKKLEWLTKILIALTILLAIIGLPPAIDTLVKYLGHEGGTKERPAPAVVTATSKPESVPLKSTPTETTASATTTATTSTVAAGQKTEHRPGKAGKKL